MNNKLKPLDHKQVYTPIDPAAFDFGTTDELDDIDLMPGQERALDALHLGMQISGDGYNIFALGAHGAGKQTTVRQVLKKAVEGKPPASDWCYVNNFEQPHKPQALRLPPGRGVRLQEDMEQLVDDLGTTIPAAFESDEYRSRTEEVGHEFAELQEKAFEELREDAEKQGILLIKTPAGFAFAPKDHKDEVLNPDEFHKLAEPEKQRIQTAIEGLQARLQEILGKALIWRKETRKKVKDLDREFAAFAVSQPINDLKGKYADLPEIVDYLDAVQSDVIQNVDDFRAEPEAMPMIFDRSAKAGSMERYEVNLLVDNSTAESVPIVHEDLPSHANLVGRCEHRAHMGTLSTDFTMIKPGALHRANGGYLILDARKVLLQPYAWESLKRTLEAREIRIESLERTLSLMSTHALEPGPIPLNTKVVLVGDRSIYYLLKRYDPEFTDLFKIAADFEDTIDRSDGSNLLYARMVASLGRHHELRPLDRDAVARIIEQCARRAGDAEKLSVHIRSLSDLLREADYWAQTADRSVVTRADVQQAIDKQIYRSDRVRERVVENIARGTIIIDTDGDVIGQVNGLSVLELGDLMFGQPSRITAKTRLGGGEFIDIERETELGGSIHSKGVFILSSFLASRYARGTPLSMTASVVFEQSYGGVEGDSASLGELCAILSSLSETPIRQSFALTGSVNQHGQVQPIGGVNEKIEGFYDVCKSMDLSGRQAVIIPDRNVKHLMLRDDVVDAIKQGRFCVYAVGDVDQALELLTGVQAGVEDDNGRFPPDSVNGRVESQLLKYAAIRQRFGQGTAAGPRPPR